MKTSPIGSISIPIARHIMLAAQGLDRLPQRPAIKADILDLIRRMGYLQIDTIHVVARSPYLVLWSRLGDYPPEWLDDLLAEGALFEYWAHAMCFLPIEDFPLYRRRMLDFIEKKKWVAKWALEWTSANPQVVERVLTHLRQNGSVRSAEFENKNPTPGGWWNWKDEKNALEALLILGEVMVTRRHNFQRIYDLRERIQPGWDDADAPSSAEVTRTFALRAVSALGVATPAWVSEYYRLPKTGMPQQLENLASEGLLHRLEIEGIAGPAYISNDRLNLLEKAAGSLEPILTTVLSPFDPLVSDRQRARELFDFDYTIECYTPAAKRIYGYFTLPILHRGELVGRLDPKAHRSQGIFEIKALHLEPRVPLSEDFIAGLATALRRLAEWHATPEVVITAARPPEFADLLRLALQEIGQA